MKQMLCLMLLAGGLACLPLSAAPATRPNVLFIIADDLRCSLGCYGDPQVKTPHLDRLAARGMKFERAYCQYPVCNPSRTSFLTGLRPDHTGVLENETPLRRKMPDIVTLPQLFRENGWFTASLGKVIHAGLDAKGKRVFHQDAKSWDDCRKFDPTPLGLKGEGRNVTNGRLSHTTWLAAEGADDDQPDGQNATEAIKIMEAAASKEKPFFLGVGFHKPHDPFNAPKKYFDLYPLDQIQLARDPADKTPELQLAIPNAAKPAYDAMSDDDRREFRRAYYAGVSFADAQAGRLLDTLDRLKLWDSTIVVFVGDHGYHLGEHEWWNKVTVFELCARTPLIVWAPGMKGMGSATRGIVEFVDLYPTLADLAGLKPPARLDGTSFRMLLQDPASPGRPAAFTQVVRSGLMGRSVRTDRWRYTEWDGGKRGAELYDHSNDPLEYHNLAKEHPQVVAELRALLPSP